MKYKSPINQINETTAEILLYGIIGKWMDIDVDRLVPELEGLKKSGVCNLTFYVNSDGGEVPQGQTFWSYLNRCDFNVTWVIDGVAASMMAMLITNPKHTVIANKYSKFMYHRISGRVYGNPDEVRDYAGMMELFENDLVDMFVLKTGIPMETAKADYFSNSKVTWLSAAEALNLKLVNEIRDGYAEISEPTNMTDAHEVFSHFSTQLINYSNNNKSQIEMKKVASLLNLPADATEDAYATVVQNILDKKAQLTSDLSKKDNEIADLKNQVKIFNEAKVKNLVDSGIVAKKYGEDMRETYTTMANTNFEMTEKVINSMAGVDPIVNTLGRKSVPAGEESKTWDDLHKEGKLENIKANDLPRFKELYKAKFNKEFIS